MNLYLQLLDGASAESGATRSGSTPAESAGNGAVCFAAGATGVSITLGGVVIIHEMINKKNVCIFDLCSCQH